MNMQYRPAKVLLMSPVTGLRSPVGCKQTSAAKQCGLEPAGHLQ